ncbi:transcriptional regulator [Streptomyces sp. NPDC091272]|uniref:transcriptional regulator n=1 Tax=Streptomyces sp. NPDC091272 TaxID=3365981 RepID=UPI00381E252F
MSRNAPPHPTGTDLLVLHSLRCAGYSTLTTAAATTGLPESDVESQLIDLAVEGLVTYSAGAFGGWGLTEAGRAADAQRISGELEAADARPGVSAALDRFLVLNPELLDLCSAWQLRAVDGVMTMNDHSDPAYDARVLSRIADLHERAEPVCAELSALLLRFRRYRERLAQALARAEAGELEYVADSVFSYHSVWFQLHEDLLATLGIPRH